MSNRCAAAIDASGAAALMALSEAVVITWSGAKSKTPPVGAAGLYKGLVELKASLERARSMGPDTPDAEQLALIELVQGN